MASDICFIPILSPWDTSSFYFCLINLGLGVNLVWGMFCFLMIVGKILGAVLGILHFCIFLEGSQVRNEGMNCEGHSFQDIYDLFAFGFLFARYTHIHGLLQSSVSYPPHLCQEFRVLFPISSCCR